MIYIILILVLAVISLLARLLYIQYEIINVTKQLNELNRNRTDNKVVAGLLNKEFEELTVAINENIEIRRQCEASRIRTENSLKRAISDMSHDLRTPLTSIMGYLQFMKSETITEIEKSEYLNIAYQRTKILEGLLDDFYTLSLVDSKDYPITLERINITMVLQELLVGRYGEFLSRNLEMDFRIPEKSIYIIGDKKSVDRVIENLISNVIKYTKTKVNISLQQIDNKAELVICNNVSDLSVEELEKLFDRAYMADKSRSTGKGTGLGLAIAKTLMEKMNGDIRISMEEEYLKICCEFTEIK